MNYTKNVYKLYLIIFFHNLIPAYVIERLFFEQRGLTVLTVVICELIYAATIVILEIPSGILADKLSRKALLVTAAVLNVLEFVALLFTYRFEGFALLAVGAGIAASCSSGSFNALLYDSLLAVQKQEQFAKILGRTNAIDLSAALIAALSGSVLAQRFDFELNYMLSAVSMLLALVFTLALQEPPKGSCGSEQTEKRGFAAYIKDSAGFYRSNPKAALLVVNAMALGACINYLDEFWQLYLRDMGLTVAFFGGFAALILLLRIPGNLIAAFLLQYVSEERLLALVLVVTAAGFAAAAIFPGIVGLAVICLIFFVSGLVDPVVSGYLHHHVSSDIRATVDSFQSLGKRAIVLMVGLGFGYIATWFSVATGFLFLSVICLLFLGTFLKRERLS